MKKFALTIITMVLAILLVSCGLVPVIPGSSEPGAVSSPASSLAGSPRTDISRDDVLTYFQEVALKSEFGGDAFEGVVRRWEEPIRFEIDGDYTGEDYNTLAVHVEALKKIGGMPEISVVESGGNYRIHFVSLEQMAQVVPGYVEGNWGFISLTWDDQGRVRDATVGIAIDVTTQAQRNHLILEEVTQGLGLLNDSPRYEDSIYQVEWTEVQSLSPVDWLLVKMLYSPAVHAGMKQDVALPALKTWLGSGSD